MKRIIAVMVALMFAAVLFHINSFSVYADGYLRPEDMTEEEYQRVMTNKYEFDQKYLYYVSQYEHGYMTHSDFVSEVNNLTEEYVQSNTNSDGVLNSIARNVSNTITDITNGIGNAVGAVGEGAKDIIDDVLNPYETTQSVPTVSTNGYGCYAKKIDKRTGWLSAEVYCAYGVIKPDGEFVYHGDGYANYYSASDGHLMYTDPIYSNEPYGSTGFSETFVNNNYYYYEVYGDVRYSDGTQAPTNDEYVDSPAYDFSNATDSELDKVLDELNETLKRENPDLSTMEGLLESIYYRLGRLDSDDDNGLLNDINLAIFALSNSNDDNAAAVIASLAEIRDEIKNLNGDINDNLDDLENNFDKIIDFDIPDELLNVDFDSLSDELKDKIDDIVELITTLAAKGVPMAAINGGLLFYQDIIFNSHEPQDIVFDLTFNGEQYKFTILSTSFFGGAGEALQIIKNFVAIVLGYAWVLAMRKKAVNMM